MPRRKKGEQPQEEIRKIKTPPLLKGARDVLPADERHWDFVESEMRRTIKDYSFKRIQTPLLEKYELFNHTLFRQSSQTEKEVFSFIDRGEKVALRPDATASVARAYIEHNMANQPGPQKLYYWGAAFRQGKMETNRLRQFTQIGFEIIGDKSAAIDAELIIIGHYLFKNLGLFPEIRLNSLGCVVCRLEYAKALAGYLKSKRAALCVDCRKRAGRDPIKFLLCKNPKCLRLREDAPQTVDWLCDECRNHLFRVLEYLDELKIPYNLDSGLVRTFDYYTKTVFEFRLPADNPEAEPVTLAGGGRYDYLIEMLGGESTPGAGLTLGLERVVNEMKNRKCELPFVPAPQVFVAQISELARQKAFGFFESIRKEGFSVKANFSKSSLKAQLDMANKLGATLVLILGQKEVTEGTVLLRDLESGIQEVVNFNRVVPEIKKRLKETKKRP